MEFTGTYIIPAPRDVVWAALQKPDILSKCIPGCEALEETEAGVFEGKVKLKVGPVRATFAGVVKLTEPVPPARLVLVGEGKGGIAGFASGSSSVLLTDTAEGTELTYNATAKIGGKMAQLGSRLIKGTVHSMADKFFTEFCETLNAPAEG